MRKQGHIILLFTFGVVICQMISMGCKATNTMQTSVKEVESIATDTLGPRAQITYNIDSTMALCKVDHKQSMNPHPMLEFFVIDRRSGNNIYGGKFQGGEVSWYDEHTLLVKQMLGIASPENPNGMERFLYDLIDKKRKSFSTEENKM